MKRTASMNLQWERNEYGAYVAQLPPVPGYPGTWYAIVDYFTGISVNGDWHLTITNRPELSVFVYENIPGIVFHAKTAEELMNNVEENLTPGMIADALQAKGIEPDDIATASRQAGKRTANLDLDWKPNIDATTYTAILPDIPGYKVQNPSNWGDHCVQVYSWGDGWQFDITLVLPHSMDTSYLTNDDFGIPNAETAEEMMQAVDDLTMDDIVFVLQQWGFLPGDGD